MKKVISFIMSIVLALSLFNFSASAASEKAPKPVIHTEYYDGYTRVWFDAPEGVTIRFTHNGDEPTGESRVYEGEKFRIKRTTRFRFLVSKEGLRDREDDCDVRVIYSSFERAINASRLYRTKTGDAEIDRYIKEAVESCTNDDMTTYEKVRECYHWTVNNISFLNDETTKLFDYHRDTVDETSEYLIEQAKTSLKGKRGISENHATIFALMCNYIGVGAAFINRIDGYDLDEGYKEYGHAYTAIYAGDKVYYFDPNMDAEEFWELNRLSDYDYFGINGSDPRYSKWNMIVFFR